jgi:hypothetical protein
MGKAVASGTTRGADASGGGFPEVRGRHVRSASATTARSGFSTVDFDVRTLDRI